MHKGGRDSERWGTKFFLDAAAMKIWGEEHKTSALVGNLGTSGSVFIRAFLCFHLDVFVFFTTLNSVNHLR